MQDMRTTLECKVSEIQTRIAKLKETLDERPGYGLGRGDPAATRREVDRALLQSLRKKAQDLEQALLRFDEGAYGLCIRCGKPIQPERLAVLPDARICIDCAQEKSTKRRNRGKK